jgi:tRNA threonylcarbamoyl adenosine modification protein YeaZ
MIMAESALVLALDTSTVVNVGVARGERVLATATVADQRAHAEQLMPLISECLDDAGVRPDDLAQLIVGLGPGPFTGLRVGVVTARVLSQVLQLQLRGICSLDVWAAQFTGANSGDFIVATDARRR